MQLLLNNYPVGIFVFIAGCATLVKAHGTFKEIDTNKTRAVFLICK